MLREQLDNALETAEEIGGEISYVNIGYKLAEQLILYHHSEVLNHEGFNYNNIQFWIDYKDGMKFEVVF